MAKKRADLLLVERGLVSSREKAKALIMAGKVFANGKRVEKAGQLLPEEVELQLKEDFPYVSRGGLKLEKALKDFKINVKGRICLDIGASTGGFTDCLLQKGAAKVYAVDVDPRQLHYKLQKDPRVIPVKLNARYITRDHIGEDPQIVTVDVSFISALKILKPLSLFLLPQCDLLVLVKPQFEAGREKVGKGGIVKDPEVIKEVVVNFCRRAEELGFYPRGLSLPIKGKEGNQEVFVYFKKQPFNYKIEEEIERLL